MKPSILVVEDNETLRFNLELFFEMQEFTVYSAENGALALEILSKNESNPDIIVSDIMMPEMDGYDFYNVVSNNPKWSKIPFIFLSAKSSPDDVRFGKQLGVDDYITKPFDEEDLLASVQGKIKKFKKNLNIETQMNEKLVEKKILPKFKQVKDNFHSFIFLEWDESEGPVVEKSISQDDAASVESLSVNLFMISQSLYGMEGITESQGFLMRLPNLNKDCYIFFDTYPAAEIRGGEKPFMLGVVAKNIHYLASLRLKDLLTDIAKKIKLNKDFDIDKYHLTFKQLLNVQKDKLSEIWIFTSDGLEMFSYAPNSDVDKDLLCGFLTAIQNISSQINKNKLDGLSIGSDKYLFYHDPDYNYYILGRANKHIMESIITEILQEVSGLFNSKYGDIIGDAIKDHSVFTDFLSDIKNWVN
jgi:DNA-binding response OmpR family regulator